VGEQTEWCMAELDGAWFGGDVMRRGWSTPNDRRKADWRAMRAGGRPVDVDVVDMHVDGLDGVGAWGYNVQPTRSPAQCTAAVTI
jgi:hypothetical protein